MVLKRVLLCGGAGFIGSHLVENLLCNDFEVYVVDNLSTGTTQNIQHLLNREQLRFIEMDISNKDLLLLPRMDFVIDLASIANPNDYEKMDYLNLLSNSIGLLNVLEKCRIDKSRFIYFSSSEIYGNHEPFPVSGLKESDACILQCSTTRSSYFVSKMFGEELTRSFSNKYGIEFMIIRPFNIYGPKMDMRSKYGRVIPNFLQWCLRKEPLKINGDGKQTRSFCYVDDFVDFVVRYIHESIWQNDVINVGYPTPISILDLAILVNRIVGYESEYIFTDKFEFEPKKRFPNIDLATSLTGWLPKTDLESGLRSTIMQDKRFLGEQ